MKSETEKEAGSCILKNYGDFFKKQHHDFTCLSENNWQENKTYSPVQLTMTSSEVTSVNDLISSDNTLMNKVLSVLSSLCIEIIELKKEANKRHFLFLSIYEEYSSANICDYLEQICLLNSFVVRCNDTLQNICTQVFALCLKGSLNLSGIQLHFIINHIGEIFTIVILIELFISNTSLATDWQKYCKQIQGLRSNVKSIGILEERLQPVMNALDNITANIMNDDIVQNSLNSLLNLKKSLVDKNCAAVNLEFTLYVKHAIASLDKLVQEKPNAINMYKCIKINGLFVLSTYLFGNNDKKDFKSLMDLNVKAHSIHIAGTTVWFPEQFLQKYVQPLCITYGKLTQVMLKSRQTYINSKKASFNRDVLTLQNTCNQWVSLVEDAFANNNRELSSAEMVYQSRLLQDGLDIACSTHHFVLTLINLHLTLGAPLSKSMLMSLFDVTDALKSIKHVLNRNRNQIIHSINMITQHLLFQTTSSILDVKKTLMTDKNYANKRLDELTCIVIAERALKGAPTLNRNIVANVALAFIQDTTYLEDSYCRLGNLLEKVQLLTNYLTSMDLFCNCSWLLWHQNIIPIYFNQNFNLKLNSIKIKYFLMVLEDCLLMLHDMDTIFKDKKSREYMDNIKSMVEESILKSTSQNIETNLRLHIHSHLQLDVVNPYSFDMTKKILLTINNFRLHTLYMSVIPSVEHYLSTMYYNLTTVVLSDWKTYGEMRQMAKYKFNLTTVQDNLPTQTLEQGLDVLEIMRNIHIFVSKYHYNLNNQIFIERSSNNKHLNTINIKHVANSIRTHGTGIMNTTVNFSYQFLKKKFYTFSQFMFDEHIKSRLIKDLRYFRETANLNKNMYSYKSAEKFNKGIKVLGVVEDGQSYLDLFRDLISQIGNAMGYVRMIRSGGRHCCSDATVFLPNLDDVVNFKALCIESNLDHQSLNSAENLDHNISVLINNFIQGTEYFKLLVEVFAPVFRNPKNVHLKNFFIIVPPLTLNFVEHMILSKDKMSKKNKAGAAFTDDGFAMGIAYILKLLDQDSQFESLHWFDSIWSHIREERNLVEDQRKKGPLQLEQALALTDKKIKTLEEEYKLLYYSLTSARIFFR